MTNHIEAKIKSYMSRLDETNENYDPHHRYLSWEHCFEYFDREDIDKDKACLHLAFYLASWGMYRGSGFLLQKDYLIHKDVVKLLLPERSDLKKFCNWDDKSFNIEKYSNQVSDLDTSIKEKYRTKLDSVITDNQLQLGENNEKKRGVSEILTTKIMLGILGCVPAYDRFFVSGLKIINNVSIIYNQNENNLSFNFSKESFKGLYKFYIENKVEFDNIKTKYKTIKLGLEYPIPKLIDMYFWQLGYEKYLIEKAKKERLKKLAKQQNQTTA